MRIRIVIVCLAVLAACDGGGGAVPEIEAPTEIEVSSSAFAEGDTIPTQYTCDGQDVSPPLSWTAPGANAAQYVLSVTDPDAPGGTFLHWLIAGIPGSTTELSEGRVPPEAIEFANDFGQQGYGGPCPPQGGGAHRYIFTVYALSRSPETDGSARDFLESIKEAVTAEGTLTGRYSR